jgi:hypothetical protein
MYKYNYFYINKINFKKIYFEYHGLLKEIFPGRTSTVVNDSTRRNTTAYIRSYYDQISPCRVRRHTAIYGEKNGRSLS